MNSDHNGQARFITPRITRTEDVEQYQRARPRAERPDHRGDPAFPSTALPAAEQYAAIYAGAMPKGNLADRVPRTQADADRQMARQAAGQGAVIDTAAILSEVAGLRAALEAQGAINARFQSHHEAHAAIIEQLRLDVLASASNSFVDAS